MHPVPYVQLKPRDATIFVHLFSPLDARDKVRDFLDHLVLGGAVAFFLPYVAKLWFEGLFVRFSVSKLRDDFSLHDFLVVERVLLFLLLVDGLGGGELQSWFL